MAITLNGDTGITTPTYGGTDTSEYLVPVTAFKNRIINGAMQIDQRNAGASVTPTNGSYNLDRWGAFVTAASKFTVQQNAGSVTPPAGFKNYLGVTSTSAYSVGAGDVFSVFQCIEGFNTADLNWGTASASSVTVSFWARSSLTGTFGGAIINAAENRSYPFTYTISSANTWEQKAITIAGDTTGTWLTNNGNGLRILFNLGTGTTFSGTAGAWAGSTFYSATGATSVVGTSGATFYITGVQLEKGSNATSFDYRPYGTELALCQRYFRRINSGTGGTGAYIGFGAQASTTLASFYIAVTPPMRAAMTVSISSLIVSDSVSFDSTATIDAVMEIPDALVLATTFSASGAVYRPVSLRAAGASSGFLTMSAEL
jgi:hypothetical protein